LVGLRKNMMLLTHALLTLALTFGHRCGRVAAFAAAPRFTPTRAIATHSTRGGRGGGGGGDGVALAAGGFLDGLLGGLGGGGDDGGGGGAPDAAAAAALLDDRAPTWEALESLLAAAQTDDERDALALRAAGRGPPSAAADLRLFDAADDYEPRVVFYRDSAAWCPYCQKARWNNRRLARGVARSLARPPSTAHTSPSSLGFLRCGCSSKRSGSPSASSGSTCAATATSPRGSSARRAGCCPSSRSTASS